MTVIVSHRSNGAKRAIRILLDELGGSSIHKVWLVIRHFCWYNGFSSGGCTSRSLLNLLSHFFCNPSHVSAHGWIPMILDGVVRPLKKSTHKHLRITVIVWNCHSTGQGATSRFRPIYFRGFSAHHKWFSLPLESKGPFWSKDPGDWATCERK